MGSRLVPARLPHGVVETRGCAISTLFGFWASLICDTSIVLAWNNKIDSALGTSSSSGIQELRRPGYSREDQSQVPEAGDV